MRAGRAGAGPRWCSPRTSCTSAAPRPTSGTRWCWACATTSARTAFPACCWACRAASTRRWCWRSRSMRWARDKVRAVMMPSPYTADISLDRRARHGGAARRALRRDFDRAEFEAFRRRWPGVQGPARGHDRGEHPGAHPRHVPDGAVQQVRPHRADHRQQERDGDRLLHAVRRHGRRLRGHQGPAQDDGVPLARWRNIHDPYGTGISPIPERIITRPPSAELRPDQIDQDSLPPYEVLDAILAALHGRTTKASTRSSPPGFDRAVVERVARLIQINEYKRRQAPVGIRVTHRSFGKDWRYPITGKFNETAGRKTAHETDHRHRQTVQARGSARGAGRGAASPASP